MGLAECMEFGALRLSGLGFSVSDMIGWWLRLRTQLALGEGGEGGWAMGGKLLREFHIWGFGGLGFRRSAALCLYIVALWKTKRMLDSRSFTVRSR